MCLFAQVFVDLDKTVREMKPRCSYDRVVGRVGRRIAVKSLGGIGVKRLNIFVVNGLDVR